MRTISASALALTLLFASCQSEDKGEYSDFTRLPLKSEVSEVQPMTGIVLWTSNGRNRTKDIQLEFSYMLYNDVCKEKDVFDWTPMDRLLEDVASRGHQLVVRFRYTYVGQESSVPDYIKALPDFEETVGMSEGQRTCFPDWRCAELMRFHNEFHRRFAERYDNDPRLAFVQTGFGLWAEYHIYDGPFELGRTFPSKEFQKEFFTNMGKWFKDTSWSISIDAADDTYSPFRKEASLRDLRFGNFDDSFMCKDHDGYNRTSWKFFGEQRYRTAPFGGEFSYYSDYDQEHCLDKAGMYNRVFEDEVAKYRMTYIIGNDQPRYQPMSRIKEASMSMGYKFTVKDFRVKGKRVAILISNTGVAPIYRDSFLSVGGVTGSFNLRNLMPGDETWVEIETREELTSASSLEIKCDHLVPGQKISYFADIKCQCRE